MPSITASESATLPAESSLLYAIIADYRDGHPRIIPAPWFRDLVVESGGAGAGTTIRFTMTVFGRTSIVRGHVTEPEPGRLLEETYPDTQTVTSFRLDPAGDASTRVTITTRWERGGLQGWIERLFAPGALRRIFRAELALLAAEAERRMGERG